MIRFERLETVDTQTILDHMRDPRIAKHLPLLTDDWDLSRVKAFVEGKAQHWDRHGIGHWAIFMDEDYVGWGGFELEEEGWDFGLVLHPDHFRAGRTITHQAFEWARANTKIDTVSFLLATSRSDRVLERFGARSVGKIELAGQTFHKWLVDLRDEPIASSSHEE